MAKLFSNCKVQSRERAKNIIKLICQKEKIVEYSTEHLDYLKRPELISFINTYTHDKDSYSIKGDNLGFCCNYRRNEDIGSTFLTKFIKDYCGSTIVKFNEVNMKNGFVVDFGRSFRERYIIDEIEHNLGMIIPYCNYGFTYQTPERLAYLKDIFAKKNIPLPKKQTARELLNELTKRYGYQPTVTPTKFIHFPREMIPYTSNPNHHDQIILCGQPIVSVECRSLFNDEEIKESFEKANYGGSITDEEDEIDAAYISAFCQLENYHYCYTYQFDFGTLVDLLDRAETIKDPN